MERKGLTGIVCLVLILTGWVVGACGGGGGEEPADTAGAEQQSAPQPCDPASRPKEPDGLAAKCSTAFCDNGYWKQEPQDGLTCWSPTCLSGASGEGKGTCSEGLCTITAADGTEVSVVTAEEAIAVEQQFADELAGPCDIPPDCAAGEKEPATPLCTGAKATQTSDGNCYCENHFSLSTCKKPVVEKVTSFTIAERGQVIVITLDGCEDEDDPRPVQMHVAVHDTGTGALLKNAIVTTPKEAVHSDFSVVPVPNAGQGTYRYEVIYVNDSTMMSWDFTWEPDVDGGRFVHDGLPTPLLEAETDAVSLVSMVRIGDANVVAFLNQEAPGEANCVWVAQADGKGAPVYVVCGEIARINLAVVDGEDLVVSVVDTEGNVSFQRLSKKLAYDGDCAIVDGVKCDPSEAVQVTYCPNCGANPAVYVACGAPTAGGGIWIGVLKNDDAALKVEPWHQLAYGSRPSLAIVAPAGNVYVLFQADGAEGGGTTLFLMRIDYKLAIPLGPTKVLGELNTDRTMPRIDQVVEQGGATVVLSGTNVHAEPEYFSQTVILTHGMRIHRN